MSTNNVVLSTSIIPADKDNVVEILTNYAKQLNRRDIEQIKIAFTNQSYEMACVYLWQKSLALLKKQISKVGVLFIAEMLDRSDISEASNISQTLSDYDSIMLAEDLGFIGKTGALRLRQSYERIQHFSSIDKDEDDEDNVRMAKDECITTIKACINNILGHESMQSSLDFRNFRKKLEEEIFSIESSEIQTLQESPYFFIRASIRVLLSLIKLTKSAQLENVLANTNLIIPLLWDKLEKPEKWQIGRAYSEIHSEGKSNAAIGLKKVLLKVKGFDYVPEDLRSKSYIKAAHNVLFAHDSTNNFYNEEMPMQVLYKMGSIIPAPALKDCMTAILSVKLGNFYGISFNAQEYADRLLEKLTNDRWEYFLNNCLSTDERILYKLTIDKIVEQWCTLVNDYDLFNKMENNISNSDIFNLLKEGYNNKKHLVITLARKMIRTLGYEA